MIDAHARVQPFCGLLYDPLRCGGLSAVVAPPYDLIGPARQADLYTRSAYNVVRLELSREEDRYGSAARTLGLWIEQGILRRAAKPAIYLYTQRFEFESQRYERNGFLCAFKLEEFTRGRILPHERTFAGPKEDRLKLLEATRTNISPIFGLYGGNHPELDALRHRMLGLPPLLAVRDDLEIDNELRELSDLAEIATVQNSIESLPILIADGHHRYETALNYRRRHESGGSATQAYDYVMMALVSSGDPGLLILPTHRLVHAIDVGAAAVFAQRARELFEVTQVDSTEALPGALRAAGRGTLAVYLHADQRPLLLRLRDPAVLAAFAPDKSAEVRRLDVSILHSVVFERLLGLSEAAVKAGGNIEYTIDTAGALAAVGNGTAAGAFLMNAPTIGDVERVSDAGATMPEKSTYFHPKLLTGLVMRRFE